MKNAAAYRVALIAQVLVFHRQVLFYAGYLFPWDFRSVHVPLATVMAHSFRSGKWPLWDPFTYCGMPLFANIQASSFYPPTFAATAAAAWLGDTAIPRLLAISVIAQIIFAGLCSFELLRKLGTRPGSALGAPSAPLGVISAWIGATVFELGCFFAAQDEHMGAMQSAVWLPLIWLAVLGLHDASAWRGKRRWLAVLVLALAMSVLGGLPQVTLAAFCSAVVLALLLAAFGEDRSRRNWTSAVLTVAAAAWAVALAAIQFIPTAEFTQNSVAKYRVEWLGSGGGIHPGALLSLVLPNYWGVFDPSTFHGPTDLTFLYLYSSLGGLALALGAMLWKPGRRELMLAAMLGIFTLAMLGDQTPIGRVLLAALPVNVRIGIHPEYFFCVFSLALGVLAGVGAERLLPRSWMQLAAGAVIVCDLLLVSSGRPMNQQPLKNEPGIQHNSADGSAELVSRIRALTDTTVPPYRFDDRPGVSYVWSSSAAILGIPTSNGCDPMAPERTIEARRAFAKGPHWGGCYQVDNAASPVLDMLNARVLLSHDALTAPGLRLAAEVGSYKIYENRAVMPRFFFAQRVRVVKDLEAASAIVRSAEFRPQEETVVEAPGGVHGEELAGDPGAVRKVRVVSFEPEAIHLETETSGLAFLVDADSWYPGWQARVDGEPVHIYPADAAFRGVALPAGKHRVEFRFAPATFKWSVAISAAALAALALLWFM